MAQFAQSISFLFLSTVIQLIPLVIWLKFSLTSPWLRRRLTSKHHSAHCCRQNFHAQVVLKQSCFEWKRNFCLKCADLHPPRVRLQIQSKTKPLALIVFCHFITHALPQWVSSAWHQMTQVGIFSANASATRPRHLYVRRGGRVVKNCSLCQLCVRCSKLQLHFRTWGVRLSWKSRAKLFSVIDSYGGKREQLL